MPKSVMDIAQPNIILCSLSIEINGKWYNPASGRLIVLKIIRKNVINEESIKKEKSFRLNLFLNFIINKLNIRT